DPAVNDYTYGDTNNDALSQPHGIGFVWASMLWDMTWALIDQYGYDPNLYTGDGGNNLAIQLMMDGLKLQACNPGFVDGRDGILLADQLLTGGQNECLLWNVFAQRGLGFSASQGSPDSRFDQDEAFDLPVQCLGVGLAETPALADFQLMPNPATGEVTLALSNASADAGTVRILGTDGRLVRSVPMPAGTTRATLDLGGLAPALYVVELTIGGAVLKERLVVQ
ncbi:MAG: M36 family metallopeptidase, partial [Flavobacteriales bacterium]